MNVCVNTWPEDGRPYVALGKILSKQSKTAEARAVYEKGCQATQGENAYIWQIRNVRRARELFDAATVADKRHIAAWHGWAVLELKQGNIKKARNLLGKGLKYCGGNEYIYQTLALLEVKATRYEQASLFSCIPLLFLVQAWAQLEMQQENNRTARQLFEVICIKPSSLINYRKQSKPVQRIGLPGMYGEFLKLIGGNIDLGRKLLKIGHAVNPRDPVLLQSLALLEYKYSTANYARVLFKRASELDPRHQSVWIVSNLFQVLILILLCNSLRLST
ncbi:hypothetical protein CsSME_00021328 [Camellia sinensis var. sinensis]